MLFRSPLFYIENGRVLNSAKKAILQAEIPEIQTLSGGKLATVHNGEIINRDGDKLGQVVGDSVLDDDNRHVARLLGSPQTNYPLGAAVFLLYHHGELG